MTRPRLSKTPWPWVVLGLAIQILPTWANVRVVNLGNITGIYMISRERYADSILPRVYPPSAIRFVDNPYDPYYFLALAVDPSLRRHVLQPNASEWVFYRGRRILFPWAAWALGLGRPDWIPYGLPLAQFLAMGAGLWAMARVLIDHGRHPSWALLHAMSLGTSICVIRPLSDLFATNFLLLGSWAWLRRRDALAATAFAAACLSKETSILLPAVLGAWSLASRQWRRASWLLLAPLVMGLWWASLASRLPGGTVDSHNLGVPFAALGARLLAPPLGRGICEAVALWSSVVGLVCVVLAPPRSWDVWRIALVPMALLSVLSADYIWYDYWSYGRVHMAIPAFLLWCYALHGRRTDLITPVASAVAGVLVWYAQLGYREGVGRIVQAVF